MKKRYFGIALAITGLLSSTLPSSAQEFGRMFCDSPLSFFCPAPPPPPPPPPVPDMPPPAPAPMHHHKKKMVHKHKMAPKPAEPAAAPQ
jgi:hypothetical protein